MRLMRWLMAFVIALVLSGCTLSYVAMPAYVVMLTQRYPSAINRCTGVLVDGRHVLTAAHCVKGNRRVITPDGIEAFVIDAQYAHHDMVLLTLDRMIWLRQYAKLGTAQPGSAQIYGTCPYYWGHHARQALYVGMVSWQIKSGAWLDLDVWDVVGDDSTVCGGDSGGVVMQGGSVVGVTSAVESVSWWVAIGQRFYTVPAEVFSEIERGGE